MVSTLAVLGPIEPDQPSTPYPVYEFSEQCRVDQTLTSSASTSVRIWKLTFSQQQSLSASWPHDDNIRYLVRKVSGPLLIREGEQTRR